MTDLPHILVVDDEPINLAVIEEYLSEIECRVSLANDGQEAIDMLEANPQDFDVILLDRMMPRLNGIQVMERISANPEIKRCPIILQTAMAAKNEIIEGMNAGAFYYLTKPFDGDMLLSIVNAALLEQKNEQTLREDVDKSTRPLKNLRSAEFEFQSLQEVHDLALFIANACPQPERVVMGLSEMLINAIEHGNLKIGYEEKTTLNNEGRWEQEIERRLNLDENKDKFATLSFKKDASGCYIVVKDQGNGFKWQEYMTMSVERATDNHGRGIAMAAMLGFDKVEYRGCGNEVELFVKAES